MNYTSFIFSLNSESHFQETNPNRKCLILHVALTTTATSNITSCQRLIPHAAWIAIPSFNNIAKYFATHHHHHLRHYHLYASIHASYVGCHVNVYTLLHTLNTTHLLYISHWKLLMEGTRWFCHRTDNLYLRSWCPICNSAVAFSASALCYAS